ncbi:hypothetical protein YC2023_082678 [Brassica napus]
MCIGGVEATPLVGHVLVQYWRCDFERKTKDEGDEEDSGFREKESRCSHRGRIPSVAFVTKKSSESFVDDQFPWLSSTKNLGGVARRRISVAMSVGESLWLSSTEEIGGSPLQTNSSVGAKLNRKEQWRSCVTPALGSLALSGALVESLFCNAVVVAKIKNATLILLVLKHDQIVKTLETIKRVSPRRALLMGMAQAFGHHKSFRLL